MINKYCNIKKYHRIHSIKITVIIIICDIICAQVKYFVQTKSFGFIIWWYYYINICCC